MRRLIVMRHAKSSWDDPEADDRDRPLNARGRLASALMGAWLAENDLRPDHALVSTARRSIETLERLRPAGGIDAGATELAGLYMADADAALEALRAAPEAARTLLMIVHQPGGAAFLRRLADGSEGDGCRRAYEKFPTAAVAVLELPDAAWRETAFGKARFRRFAVPRDLV